MIKIIIMFAIFYAGYQIGTEGLDEFMSSLDFEKILDSVSETIAWLDDVVDRMRG